MTRNKIVVGVLSAGLLFGGASTFFAAETLDCTAAGTRDVYDTPSGKVEPGYYDPITGIGSPFNATTGRPAIIATVLRSQAFEICTDAAKKSYEYDITQKQLSDFKTTSSPLPVRMK